jgi:MerR HTH family regulatory protein
MADTLEATDALDEAARLIARAVMDAPLTQGERSYLGAVSTRLASVAARIRADAEPEAAEPSPLRRPGKFYSRTEAAALIGCDPNTLLNWERRELLTVRRDARGWRTYGREELARAYALAARVPLAELPTADTHR